MHLETGSRRRGAEEAAYVAILRMDRVQIERRPCLAAVAAKNETKGTIKISGVSFVFSRSFLLYMKHYFIFHTLVMNNRLLSRHRVETRA